MHDTKPNDPSSTLRTHIKEKGEIGLDYVDL